MLILTAFLLCETTLQHDVLSRSNKLNSLLRSAGGVHHIHKPTANTYCLRVVAQLCVYCNQIETWFWSEYHTTALGLSDYTNSYSKNTNNGCTITVWDDVISWHIDSTPTTVGIVFNSSKNLYDVASTGYKIFTLVAHWHSDSCTSCSCIIFLQYWCRSSKNATGKGGDCKCFNTRSMSWGAAWR